MKKDDLQYLNKTTSLTNEAMALKFLPHTTLILDTLYSKGLLYWNKID